MGGDQNDKFRCVTGPCKAILWLDIVRLIKRLAIRTRSTSCDSASSGQSFDKFSQFENEFCGHLQRRDDKSRSVITQRKVHGGSTAVGAMWFTEGNISNLFCHAPVNWIAGNGIEQRGTPANFTLTWPGETTGVYAMFKFEHLQCAIKIFIFSVARYRSARKPIIAPL